MTPRCFIAGPLPTSIIVDVGVAGDQIVAVAKVVVVVRAFGCRRLVIGVVVLAGLTVDSARIQNDSVGFIVRATIRSGIGFKCSVGFMAVIVVLTVRG